MRLLLCTLCFGWIACRSGGFNSGGEGDFCVSEHVCGADPKPGEVGLAQLRDKRPLQCFTLRCESPHCIHHQPRPSLAVYCLEGEPVEHGLGVRLSDVVVSVSAAVDQAHCAETRAALAARERVAVVVVVELDSAAWAAEQEVALHDHEPNLAHFLRHDLENKEGFKVCLPGTF